MSENSQRIACVFLRGSRTTIFPNVEELSRLDPSITLLSETKQWVISPHLAVKEFCTYLESQFQFGVLNVFLDINSEIVKLLHMQLSWPIICVVPRLSTHSLGSHKKIAVVTQDEDYSEMSISLNNPDEPIDYVYADSYSGAIQISGRILCPLLSLIPVTQPAS